MSNLRLGQNVREKEHISLTGHYIEHGVQGFVVARQTLLLGNSMENPSRWRGKMWVIRVMKLNFKSLSNLNVLPLRLKECLALSL